ncbi:O-unit flippase-like protein [Flavobacterium sp.]|jgi:O-antigen/teichoic acid export membrane protein|uniref:O-unit flippase-like protein n=1 Tax=Flavobacterium sp. TaxID=239 RepID=UPI0037BF8617
MQINHKDLFWNYGATFLKIASSVILLPLILRRMPTEMVGIWSIFMTITAFASLLDFGFNPSFARNITYVFSGVNNLNTKGYERVYSTTFQTVDYGLLKGVISAMQWFYFRMAFLLFLILSTFGTYYIYFILENYKGDVTEIYIAWTILCLINTYNIFSLYYDSLLQGKGLVKKSKQIVIIGYLVYLVMASFLIFQGYGIVAIVSAQASSVIIIRWLSYKFFFTEEIKQKLAVAVARDKEEVLKAIYPNALKIGLTSFGGFIVQRSALIIGSLYLTLNEIATYGISMQLIAVITGLAGIYAATFQPKIVQLRVENDLQQIKKIYVLGQIFLLSTFLVGGLLLIFFGEWGIGLIGSQTVLMNKSLIIFAVLVSFLECNHSIAGNMILTKNEVPFFKASLFSALATIILLFIFFNFFDIRIASMIAAPAIAQGVYQNWKWPIVVKNDLGIKFLDFFKI